MNIGLGNEQGVVLETRKQGAQEFRNSNSLGELWLFSGIIPITSGLFVLLLTRKYLLGLAHIIYHLLNMAAVDHTGEGDSSEGHQDSIRDLKRQSNSLLHPGKHLPFSLLSHH